VFQAKVIIIIPTSWKDLNIFFKFEKNPTIYHNKDQDNKANKNQKHSHMHKLKAFPWRLSGK
jgi:hypothetical protein